MLDKQHKQQKKKQTRIRHYVKLEYCRKEDSDNNIFLPFKDIRPPKQRNLTSSYYLRILAIDENGQYITNTPVQNAISCILHNNKQLSEFLIPVWFIDASSGIPTLFTLTQTTVNWTTMLKVNKIITSLLKRHSQQWTKQVKENNRCYS
jgi:hypothetical protein